MATPTTQWNETTPASSDDISGGDDRIRELKVQVREVVSVDHEFTSAQTAATGGQHKKVTLQAQNNLGTGASDAAILGLQGTAGSAALMYTSEDDTDVTIVNSSNKIPVTSVSNVANTTTIKSVDNAGTGTVDLINANASDQAVLPTATLANAGVLLVESTLPVTAANQGALYTKNDGTQTELYFGEESAGDEVQVTKGGVLDTALSIVIKSGTASNGDTLTLPTLATGKSSTDYNLAYSVSVNSLGTYSGGDGDNIQEIRCSINTSTLVVTCTGKTRDNSSITGDVNYSIIGTLK